MSSYFFPCSQFSFAKVDKFANSPFLCTTDNVTQPAKSARALQINTFAIGVTDHVSAIELELIAGSPNKSGIYLNYFNFKILKLLKIRK